MVLLPVMIEEPGIIINMNSHFGLLTHIPNLHNYIMNAWNFEQL